MSDRSGSVLAPGKEVKESGGRTDSNREKTAWRLSRWLMPLASLKLTVVLLGLSFLLVFSGTLVQVDQGIWSVIENHFRCFVTQIEFKIFFPRAWDVSGSIPFPGGWVIGTGLLVNILAAHVLRFKIRAKGKRLALGVVVLLLGVGLTWLVLAGYFTKDLAATKDDAFWRVLFRLGKGGMAAVVLMAGCSLMFARRAGIVLLHGGVILMLLGELITGMYAVEGRMRIEEGQSINYVVDHRSVELAVIVPSSSERERVIAVPESLLERPGKINNENLPFDIEVLKFMKNSQLVNPKTSGGEFQNLATAGIGLQRAAVARPPVSGTDSSQKTDVPSAYVTLRTKGSQELLGTYLISLWYRSAPQFVTVSGQAYDLRLRFRREYKPYSIELIDFRHDRYVGTNKPKNFSSQIRLVDPSRGVDREIKIWMNNPLRYAGETFYQSGFEGETVTVLQVVQNSGWMIPYVSCMIISLGMMYHFFLNLFAFLRKRFST